MNVIKFCFIVPFLFLTPTESLPDHQLPIRPLHVLHIRKDFPGIITFGPIFINSEKYGLFTDHVSIHSRNACPCGSNDNSLNVPLIGCKEKLNAPEIYEVEEPLELIHVQEGKSDLSEIADEEEALEVISVQKDKPDEEENEIDDLISDYNDFVNKSTLTSEQIYLIQAMELDRIRAQEIHRELEILKQMKEVPDKWELEKGVETTFEESSYVHKNDNEHFEHSYTETKHPLEPEFEAKPQHNPYETEEYKSNSLEPGFESERPQKSPYETQGPLSVPHKPFEPVYETIQFQKPVTGSLEYTLEQAQEPESFDENLTEDNIWDDSTSPEVAQAIREYIENHKLSQIYPCPPKDSTQISERHENLIKSSLTDVTKRIKNYFDGIRAYAARHDDTTDIK